MDPPSSQVTSDSLTSSPPEATKVQYFLPLRLTELLADEMPFNILEPQPTAVRLETGFVLLSPHPSCTANPRDEAVHLNAG
jgi:hypothetical protein